MPRRPLVFDSRLQHGADGNADLKQTAVRSHILEYAVIQTAAANVAELQNAKVAAEFPGVY